MKNFEILEPRETLVSPEAVKVEIIDLVKELRILNNAEQDTDREMVVKDTLRKEELKNQIEKYKKTHPAIVAQVEKEASE